MFAARNLSVLSYANGFTLWHYSTDDAFGKVQEANYFSAATDMLRKNDMIIVNALDTNTTVFVNEVLPREGTVSIK